jgi:hypothetical protein
VIDSDSKLFIRALKRIRECECLCGSRHPDEWTVDIVHSDKLRRAHCGDGTCPAAIADAALKEFIRKPLVTAHPFEHGHGGACRVCGAGAGVHAS